MAKILHVDDDPYMRDATKRQLIKGGHAVYQTATVAEAEAELTDQKFDLVICDGDLKSRGDGADFAARLRCLGYNVVIMSGNSNNARPGIAFWHKPLLDILLRVEELVSPGGAKP